jgi:hypothetical protein
MERDVISLDEIKEPVAEAADEESALDNEVDELGIALGLTYQDDEALRAGGKEEERDRHRWELDPASAEDYVERTHQHADGPAGVIRHMGK